MVPLAPITEVETASVAGGGGEVDAGVFCPQIPTELIHLHPAVGPCGDPQSPTHLLEGKQAHATIVPPWRCGRSSALLEMLPNTLRHFQSIADRGACRKTPVEAQNRHLEAKKVAGDGVAPPRARASEQPVVCRAEPYPSVAPADASSTRDLISISETMT